MKTPIEWLTLVLVAITGYYAWQSHRMVAEMRKAREATLRPRLVPVFTYDLTDRQRGHILVMNLGEGTALDIEVTLKLEPDGMSTTWRAPMLKSGDSREWSPTMEGGPGRAAHPFYPASSPRTHVSLKGRCRDILGHQHEIDETTILKDDWTVDLNMGGSV